MGAEKEEMPSTIVGCVGLPAVLVPKLLTMTEAMEVDATKPTDAAPAKEAPTPAPEPVHSLLACNAALLEKAVASKETRFATRALRQARPSRLAV